MKVSDLLNIARAEIGVVESPAGSNRVKYNTWYYGKEVSGSAYPWCMVFVQWVFNQAGKRLSPVTASCGQFINGNAGKILYSGYQPGDIVFFDFDSTPDADHVGIVESVTGGKLVTIEGNTSRTSQDNGGAVMRRDDHGQYVICGFRPDYEPEEKEEETVDFAEEFGKYRKELQDNDAGEWSREAREWAVNAGLVQGGGTLPDGTPNYMWGDFLTREQMAVLLKRFAEMMGK